MARGVYSIHWSCLWTVLCIRISSQTEDLQELPDDSVEGTDTRDDPEVVAKDKNELGKPLLRNWYVKTSLAAAHTVVVSVDRWSL